MEKTKALPKRDEIDDKYKWNLNHIYVSDEKWKEDCDKVKILSKGVVKYKGKLEEDTNNILMCLNNYVELLLVLDKVFVYARMKKDEDNSKSKYQEMVSKSMSLITEISSEVAFITPEISSIPREKIEKDIKNIEELKLYDFYLEELFRQKEHCLSEKEEELLAMGFEVSSTAGNVFNMLNNVDIEFGEIEDEEGKKVELTKGRYIRFLESKDRRVRKNAFKKLYSSYSNYRNTLATLYTSNVKKDQYHYKVRKYNSSLEMALDSDNIKTEVYDNLINTVSSKLDYFYKYLEIKKKMLNLDELYLYDLFAPVTNSKEDNIKYEDAVKTVKNGLGVLGKEYVKDLEKAFNSGWVDVYETKDKTSGAYSWGAYNTHPYVLLNYQGTLNDISTIAHEMGHALHSYYTNMTQPYIYSEYKIFVAEVASTVNESLLIRYLIDNTDDKEKKKYLIHHYLEEFRGTVFRQTMFAEFEKITHEKIESGQQLTLESLNEIYFNLNKKYFGDSVVLDKEIEIEWARIPHFYSSFYVYKYATGFSAATSIAKNILDKKENSTENYLEFLKGGASKYPLDLLKGAGVDLKSPKPIEDALELFKELTDELEKLL